MRGMVAKAHSGGLGIPRSAANDHGAAIYFAVPRAALQLWLPGVPESRRSGRTLEAIEAGRDWRATHGRLHDGSRSERERAGLPSSRLYALLCRRRGGTLSCKPMVIFGLWCGSDEPALRI